MNRFAAFGHWLGTPFRHLLDVEGRRAWALMLLTGAAIVTTIGIGICVYMIRYDADHVFYIVLGLLCINLTIITAFSSLLVQRDVDINALGVNLKFKDQAIQQIAQAVVAATPPPPPPQPQAPSILVQTAPQVETKGS